MPAKSPKIKKAKKESGYPFVPSIVDSLLTGFTPDVSDGETHTVEDALAYSEEVGATPNLTPLQRHQWRHCLNAIRAAYDSEEFGLRAHQWRNYLETLEKRVGSGYINDLRELALMACETTRIVNELAQVDPKFVAVVARGYATWPVLLRPPKAKRAAHRELFESIELGADVPFEAAAFQLGEETGAKTMAAYILGTLNYCITQLRQFGPIRKTTRLDHYWIFPDVAEKASKLAPLGPQTISEWWRVGRLLLTHLTDDKPADHPMLKRYAATTRAKNDPSKKHNEPVKQVRQAFMEIAKRVFEKI